MLLNVIGTNSVNISEHQILSASRRLLNNVIYSTIWMLTVNNNVLKDHIIVIYVLITVNYTFCYSLH